MVPEPSHSDYTLLALTVASLLAVGALIAAHLSLRARVLRLDAELREARADIRFLRNQALGALRAIGAAPTTARQLSTLLAEARGFFAVYAPSVLASAGMLSPDHCGHWQAARVEEKDPEAVEDPRERRVVSVTREEE